MKENSGLKAGLRGCHVSSLGGEQGHFNVCLHDGFSIVVEHRISKIDTTKQKRYLLGIDYS